MPSDILVLIALTCAPCVSVVNGAAIIRTKAEPITLASAIQWLETHRPKDGATQAFVSHHARGAIASRNKFGWARSVPTDLFFEYVLPYATFDEKREDWRQDFAVHLQPLLAESMTLAEAANAVQKGIWTAFGDPPLEFKANSTPEVLSPMSDLLVKRHGSCTAMSIFLVDGFRACGIPARVVGVSVWNRPDKGNHNWVEVWFDGRWNFADAVPGEVGWNSGWFTHDVRRSEAGTLSGVYTPTWVASKATGTFVVPWREKLKLPAIDITSTYVTAASSTAAGGNMTVVYMLSLVLCVGVATLSWRYYGLRHKATCSTSDATSAAGVPRISGGPVDPALVASLQGTNDSTNEFATDPSQLGEVEGANPGRV